MTRDRDRILEAPTVTSARSRLRTIKIAHTVIWAFFVACIVAIPIFAWSGDLGYAAISIGIVSLEVVVLALNRWSCPLTPMAGRYTEDRRDNFDVYLPEWLARHNKVLFGVIFVLGAFYTLARWQSWLP
jgi:hypothetical protein